MSKGLEALERISKGYIDTDDVETIQKVHKTLVLLIEYRVQISWFTSLLKTFPNYTEDEYNFALPDNMKLTKEDYEILKEVLS